MKLLVSSLLIMSAIWTFAEEDEYIMSNYYYVVSDVKSDKVEKGKCVVKGRVINPYTEEGVSGGIVANLTRTSYSVTDDSGYYEITIPATDTTVFFYHEKYNEIVCWSYKFKSKHVVEMNFVTNEKLPDGVIIEVEKPVIYLYPEKTTKVKVKLETKHDLTITYPKYEDGWEVIAEPNGQLSANGRSYPYLYWEAETDEFQFKMVQAQLDGQTINTDSTVQFLENELSALGLNERESTDFITYWAPRIMKSPYAKVNFLVDDVYDSIIGEINIEPAPDAVRRVYILFEGSSEPLSENNIKTTYKEFNREGFTVVEWGGSELNFTPSP